MAGVGISTHFCAGKVKSTRIFSFSDKSCCSQKKEKNGCCSHQVKLVKLEKEQLSSSSRLSVKSSQYFILASTPVVDLSKFYISSPLVRIDKCYSPPLSYKKRPVLYCTYLI